MLPPVTAICAAAGYMSWAALRAAGAADPGLGAALAAREAELHPDDPINIQYTSGACSWVHICVVFYYWFLLA